MSPFQKDESKTDTQLLSVLIKNGLGCEDLYNMDLICFSKADCLLIFSKFCSI